MSHSHLRKDKTCLNCGAEVAERYCTRCGQENVEPKESAWHLIVHFFNDITHFDGKFFNSMKYLLFRPGFLTAEYIIGRRARYLNPIRMYLFISAAFFLLYGNWLISGRQAGVEVQESLDSTQQKPTSALKSASKKIKSIEFESDKRLIILKNGDTVTQATLYDYEPATIAAYDSFQAVLPEQERASDLSRYFARKMLKVREDRAVNRGEANRLVRAKFFHAMPKIMFICMPVLALLLKLLYRRRREYNYTSHAIFVIHYISFLFIAIPIIGLLKPLGTVGYYLGWAVQVFTYIHLYKAMQNFYKQHWFKTLLKFVLVYAVSVAFFALIFFVVTLAAY